MVNKYILYTSFMFCCNLAFSQNEAANWYFGQNAGVNFNAITGEARALTDGQLSTLEGCASISDRNGNLLFYTDGRLVWNRNHQIMPNGTGLKGDNSSTSSALIVPKPNTPNIYYIFTVDEPHHFNSTSFPTPPTPDFGDDGVNDGLTYSELDMTAQNGLGDVVGNRKNIPLITYNTNNTFESEFKCSEKITAVRAADCNSIWLITHFKNTFYAFSISNNGINTTPITSTVGPFISIQGYRHNALGYLKASPNGKKLAMANFSEGSVLGNISGGSIYLFDFDNATGIVSNSIELYSTTNDTNPYGIEFSSESKKIYGSVHIRNSNSDSRLLQWDLESEDIPNSVQTIHTSDIYSGGALQLAINKKIYLAQAEFVINGVVNSRYLGVINNPEANGSAVNFVSQGLLLDVNNNDQNLSRIGLPPFIQSLFTAPIDLIRNNQSTTELNLCEGESYTLKGDEITGAQYTWTKDGNALQTPSPPHELVVNSPGLYKLVLEPGNGECPSEGVAQVTLVALPTANDINIIQCDVDGVNDGITTFNISNNETEITAGATNVTLSYYLTRNAAENQIAAEQITPTSFRNTLPNQELYVRVVNNTVGCVNFSKITLMTSFLNRPDVILQACDDDGNEDGFTEFRLTDATPILLGGLSNNLNINYFSTENDALVQTNPLRETFTNTEAETQTLFARIQSNNNNCVSISKVTLIVKPLPNITPNSEERYCLNFFPETITLDAAVIDNRINDYDYAWSTGENTYEININTPNTYTVTVTHKITQCSKRRTINVATSNIATITNINILDASDNNTITILVKGEGNYEYALKNIAGPYQNSNVFNHLEPGLHTVFVRDKNNCGIVNKDIFIIGFPKYFTPNGDGINDLWQIIDTSEQTPITATIEIFNRFGKLLTQINAQERGWDGKFNGALLPESDYWFKVQLPDGRIIKDHFTLKR